MIASQDANKASAQPQSSGWYISTPSTPGAPTIEVFGITFEFGPKNVAKRVRPIATRWAKKSYQGGFTTEDLVRAIGKTHRGMAGGDKALKLDLHDENEFPALGASPMATAGKHLAPLQYWFAMPRKPRVHKRSGGERIKLPAGYVATFSDTTRGPSNNPNQRYLADYTAEDFDMDESEFADFMSSGLGPKEYKTLGKVYRALMRRVAAIRGQSRGKDSRQSIQDVAIDAATISKFCPAAGLPLEFGNRLWKMFADAMWHDDYSPDDVLIEAKEAGIIGEDFGAAALALLRRVNPDVVWNYTGKSTPAKARRQAENRIQMEAQLYSDKIDTISQADLDVAVDELTQDFYEDKYPVSEESDAVAAEGDCDNASHSAGELSSAVADDREPKLSAPASSSDTDTEDSAHSARYYDACTHLLTAHDKKKRKSQRLTQERKSVRQGGLVQAAERREAQQRAGEAEGLREYYKQREEEDRAIKEEADRFSGFDPDKVLTFKNRNGYMVMRPVTTGIVVDEAYAKGAHLFGWVAEVASTKVSGSCFIPVDKLKMVKSKYWSVLTEPAKTAILQSLVGEKWPYMPSLYIGNVVDVERKAYDIAFEASGNGYLELKPTTTSSKFDATGNKMIERLLMPDPNYRKDDRAFQLLPLEDTHMAALFPICRQELEKMIAKRLTSRFKAINWVANPPADSPWYLLYGSNSWEAEPIVGPDGVTGFFRSYAEKVIAVKTTLTGPEKQQWRDTATLLDTMSREDILARLRHCIRQETHGMIKNELYGKDTTTLRLIISPALFVKIAFGAVIKRIEEHLYSGDPSLPLSGHHIKHLALSHAEERFTSWQRNDGGKFYETDYSAYESSQNCESLAKEFELYKSYYVQDGLADSILNTVLSEMLSGNVTVRNKYFKIKMPVMRWSGMPNTACGNLLMNYYNLVVNCGLDPNGDFLLEGDDGIMWGPPELGDNLSSRSAFPLTMDSSEDYSNLSFCGLHYSENAHIPADENLAVARLLTYFDTKELSMQKRYELLYMRLVSYQLLYPKWPVLDLIIQQAERYYHDVARREISEATIRRWFADQGWWLNQMLGEFTIDDIVKPGKNYAFVHLCCETLDQIRQHSRNRQLARSDDMMDRLVPEYAGPRSSEMLRVAKTLLAVAGPLAGVALLCSGHKKAAIMAMATSASAVSAIQSLTTLTTDDPPPENKLVGAGTLDKIWTAMAQSVTSMFSSNKL